MSTNLILRRGQKTDLQRVYGMVKELALFENEPEAVISTVDDYILAFEEGLISLIVAEKANDLIGMALFYDTFSTWRGKMLYLEDFYVKPAHRSLGIGDMIFDAVIEESLNRKCKILKWQVLDWNTGAVKFYERKKATIEKNWWNGKILFD